MAKLLFTAIVADMRNKLNGTVFSKNRYGAYARTKVTPVNPQTAAQAAVRNRLSSQSQAWRGLTQSQRNAWQAAASNFPFTDIFGNSKVLSGQALFVKLNANIVNAGGLVLTDPPAPVGIPELILTSVTPASGAGTMDLVFNGPTPASMILIVQATPQVSPGKSFVKNLFRQVSTYVAATASPLDLHSVYVARFGSLVAGQKIFVRAYFIDVATGQVGIASEVSSLVS